MASYSKEQSTIVALWVLAMQQRLDPNKAIQNNTAPDIIAKTVNMLGEHHSPDSILLHTHGYDRLLFGRNINKSVTRLQQEVANELKSSDIISKVHEIT